MPRPAQRVPSLIEQCRPELRAPSRGTACEDMYWSRPQDTEYLIFLISARRAVGGGSIHGLVLTSEPIVNFAETVSKNILPDRTRQSVSASA